MINSIELFTGAGGLAIVNLSLTFDGRCCRF